MAVNSVDGRGVPDVRDLFNLLESNQLKTVDEITEEIQQHLSAGVCQCYMVALKKNYVGKSKSYNSRRTKHRIFIVHENM
jgi:hypothetical protein